MTTSVTYQRFYINFISQDENTFLVVTIQSWKNFTNCLNALTCITSRSRLSNNITQCKLIWKIQIVRNARYAFVLLRWKLAAFDIKWELYCLPWCWPRYELTRSWLHVNMVFFFNSALVLFFCHNGKILLLKLFSSEQKSTLPSRNNFGDLGKLS